MDRIPVIFGPTASGKSAVAIRLAEALGGEIINADSRQIYTRMPIITACPTADDYARVPHHLYEFLSPDQRYSAGAYAVAANAVIADIIARNKIPIIVGGTGLYLKVLMEGVSPVPPIAPEIIEAVQAEVDADIAAAYARLQRVDAPWAARIQSTDAQRIARGLSVADGTDKPLSAWQQVKGQGAPYHFTRIGIGPPRDILNQRIEARWKVMLAMGVVDEIAALKTAGFTPAMDALKGLGIPEIYAFLSGNETLDAAVERGIIAHRQYAKRQVTWLNNQFKPDVLVERGEDVTVERLA